jgi:hypothetical protein
MKVKAHTTCVAIDAPGEVVVKPGEKAKYDDSDETPLGYNQKDQAKHQYPSPYVPKDEKVDWDGIRDGKVEPK